MNDVIVWGGLTVGALVVILTSVFKTIDLSTKWKHTIAVGLSAVGGVLLTWKQYNGNFSVDNLAAEFAAVYASSQLIYNYILKGTNLDQILEAFKIFGKSAPAADVVVETANQVLQDGPGSSGA